MSKKHRAGQAHPERYAVQARQSKLLTHFSRRAQHLTITRRSFARSWQRICWRNYGLGRAPWYGADTAGTSRSTIQLSRALLMPLITSGGVGSLLTAETTTWNVGLLHSAPSRRLQYTGKESPGSQFSVTLLRKMVRNLRLALRKQTHFRSTASILAPGHSGTLFQKAMLHN